MTASLIPTVASHYGPDSHISADFLVVKIAGCYNTNHKIGYVGPNGTARRVFQGPIAPGPYAYPVALATVISAHRVGNEPTETLELEDGDHIVVNGVEFELIVRQREPHFMEVQK